MRDGHLVTVVLLTVQNGALVLRDGLLGAGEGCCCHPPEECPCLFPTEWRITDSEGHVYAKGPVVAAGGPQCETVVPALEDLPNPFSPQFYWADGEVGFTLELLGCNGDSWDTLDSWSATISLCDGGRYPSQPLDGPWQPPGPGPCQCKNQQNVDDGIEECDPCPDLNAGSGDGQAWRDPQPGTATTFTGAIDGEWTNLMNWEDANGLTPAGSLPGSGTNVSVEANVTSTAVAITVAELTIAAGAEFSVAASAADLHCYGEIERDALCEGVFGVVTVSGEAFVYGGGQNNGEIVNALVKFSGDGLNGTEGVVTGDARFDDTSVHSGLVTGDTEVYDTANMQGSTVNVNATFNGDSYNNATVEGDATFNGSAYNLVQVDGNATFNGTSKNENGGVVAGNAIFNNSSRNAGNINGVATFNGSSENEFTGTLNDDANFTGTAKNYGSATAGDITFTANSENHYIAGVSTFSGSAINATAGTVGAGTFTQTSRNEGTVTVDAVFQDSATNAGDVGGNAIFSDSACNDGGTAGTFVPDPPPSC